MQPGAFCPEIPVNDGSFLKKITGELPEIGGNGPPIIGENALRLERKLAGGLSTHTAKTKKPVSQFS